MAKSFEKFDYIPSIKYKNFILEQEKWKIRFQDLKIGKRGSLKEFKVAIQKYITEKNYLYGLIWLKVTKNIIKSFKR